MPTEMRRLIFSDREVTDALNLHLKQEWTKLQLAQDKAKALGKVLDGDGGGIVLKLMVKDSDPLVVMALTKTGRGQQIEREFSAVEMVAIVINYCRSMKIPVARSAQKVLRKAKVGIALDLTIRQIATDVIAQPA